MNLWTKATSHIIKQLKEGLDNDSVTRCMAALIVIIIAVLTVIIVVINAFLWNVWVGWAVFLFLFWRILRHAMYGAKS